MERNFDSPLNIIEQESSESLKSHNRTVATSVEMNQLVGDYTSKGWEITEQDEIHTKLTKSFNSVQDTTPRIRGTIVTLEVSIKVAE